MKRAYKETGVCKGCKYYDVVDKKWYGCSTMVCTYKSPMGRAIPYGGHRPKWCYGYVAADKPSDEYVAAKAEIVTIGGYKYYQEYSQKGELYLMINLTLAFGHGKEPRSAEEFRKTLPQPYRYSR